MKVYDISTTIEPDMIVWKDYDKKKPVFDVTSNHDSGHSHETKLTLDIHAGTHFDMPLHMISGGKNLDSFDISKMITPCKVFDMTFLEDKVLTAEDIKGLPINKDDFVLFKTKNSFRMKEEGFDPEFVFVNESAALLLKTLEIKGVGIDAPGIERSQEGHPTHVSLLEDDIVILEGLCLKDVQEGTYELIALPLKIKGVEAGLVRAVLIEK